MFYCNFQTLFSKNVIMFCSSDDNDCILNTTFNETQQNVTIDDVLINSWPYRLQGLTKMDSPIYLAIVACNQQVFPPDEIIDRVACKQPYQ